MSSYSLAEAATSLSALVDRATQGERITLTKDGKPVAALTPLLEAAPQSDAPAVGSYEWLRARRLSRPSVDITSVQLINDMYDE